MKHKILIFGIVAVIIVLIVSLYVPPYRATREHVMAMELRRVLTDYKSHFGFFPQGDTPSILKALQGDNPDKLVFFSPPSQFIDSWNTQIRIYISGDDILIRSAGKNRKFDAYHGKIGDHLLY